MGRNLNGLNLVVEVEGDSLVVDSQPLLDLEGEYGQLGPGEAGQKGQELQQQHPGKDWPVTRAGLILDSYKTANSFLNKLESRI